MISFKQTELELAVAWAAELLVEEDRPEPLVLDLVLQALYELPDLRIRIPHGVGEYVPERLDLLSTELVDPVELLLELRFGGEIPSHRSHPMIVVFVTVCPAGARRRE